MVALELGEACIDTSQCSALGPDDGTLDNRYYKCPVWGGGGGGGAEITNS